MQTKHSILWQSHRLLIGIIAMISFLLIFLSCKEGKKSKQPNCVKLTKEQIHKWVKKGYTDSTSKDYMVALRFTTAYAGPGAMYRVYVMGQRKDNTLIEESLTELSPMDTCDKKHISLSSYIFTGTIPVNFSDLNIMKPGGKLNDSLLYIRMQPYDWMDPKTKYNYMAYDFTINMSGGVVIQPLTTEKGIGLPCPPCPNCPVNACPKPPTCETCGPGAFDTILQTP